MKRETRLYNVILPLWLLLALPTVYSLIVIPANLLVDCLVCLIAMLCLRVQDKDGVLGQVWWKIWLLGFAADAVGVVWMLLGAWGPSFVYFNLIARDKVLDGYPAWLDAWENSVGYIGHSPFSHPAAILWTLAGVALAGVCIYFWDRKVLRKCPQLDGRQSHITALVMAIVTAPWLFFVSVY